MVENLKNNKKLANRLPFQARAAKIGYLVLNIPTIFILVLLFIIVLTKDPAHPTVWQAVIIFVLYGFIWIIWLKGFRISIDLSNFEYRDGLHRSHSISLTDIKKTEFKWVDWRVLTTVIKIPRLIIHSKQNEDPIWINIKPFSKNDLKELREILDEFPLV